MSYPNQQAFDYEPVTRRVDAEEEARASVEHEFAAPSAFEFPAPRFVETETVAGFNATAPKPAPRREEPARTTRRHKHESWIVKRGHTLTYLGIFLFTFVVYFRPYELIPEIGRAHV